MRYFYRCSNTECQKRRTLSMWLEQYKIAPSCHSCGSKEFRLDKYRQDGREKKANADKTCYRDCYPFPHRKHSEHCEQNPKPLEE